MDWSTFFEAVVTASRVLMACSHWPALKKVTNSGVTRNCSLGVAGKAVTMLMIVGIVCAALAIFILKYVFSSSGPNPFETDTREPLKEMVHVRKEKNKVLKQGELQPTL